MKNYDGYGMIAHVYDKLNSEIDYSEWADFNERLFEKYLTARPEIVLDLACGTGSMTLEMVRRGYDMIGVDGSEDMLSVAYDRWIDLCIENEEKGDGEHTLKRPLYLLQDMREFELYGTVGAVLCCLDSINYLIEDGAVERCFSCVHNYLDPDGLFVFDVNTPYKFENIYSDNAYILEDEMPDGNGGDGKRQIYCGWQNHYDRESGICDFYLSLFEEKDGVYQRSDECQRERCHTAEKLGTMLKNNGFELLGIFGDTDMNEPKADCERYYIVARAKK